jgi:hypothetical protein
MRGTVMYSEFEKTELHGPSLLLWKMGFFGAFLVKLFEKLVEKVDDETNQTPGAPRSSAR